MIRDFNYLRELLFEAKNAPYTVFNFIVDRRNKPVFMKFDYHHSILLGEGFIKKHLDDKRRVTGYIFTSKGQDFLSLIESNYVWTKVQEDIRRHGNLDMASVKKLAKKYRNEEIDL